MQQARHNDDKGSPDADGRIGWRKGEHSDCNRHKGQNEKHCGFSATSVGIDSKQDAANGPHEKADAERSGCQQQRRILTTGRKKQSGDDDRQKAKADEIIPFERIANDGRGDLQRLRRALGGATATDMMPPAP